MKRFTALVMICMVLFSFTVPVSAAIKDEADPLYTHVNSIYASLTIDQATGIATCTGDIVAKKAVPVEVVVSLQVYEDGTWQTLKSWSVSDTLAAQSTTYYAVYSGYKYRVYVTGYVYNASGIIQESASVFHEVNYPKK